MSALLFMAAFGFSLLHGEIDPVEIHVPSGADLHAMRDQVRTLNTTMTNDIVVYLADGTYVLTNTLEFTSQDSATGGHRIIWRNEPGTRPCISGGQVITGWIEQGGDIVTAPVPAGSRFRQLYVNGLKAERAEYLNGIGNWARVQYDAANKRCYMTQPYATSKGITTGSSWATNTNVEINLGETFRTHQLKLKSITTDFTNTYLNIAEPAATFLGSDFGNNGSGVYYPYDIYFENALEFVTDPGEWYLSEAGNTVYYKLNAGETVASISAVAPVLQHLVRIDGANDLQFFGLCFEHSTWLEPSDNGLVSYQNLCSGDANVPIPAAIDIRNSRNIQFERNIIRYTGGTGIMAWDESVLYLSLLGNCFYETAAAALQLGNDDKRNTTVITSGLYQPSVCENSFVRCGMQYSTTAVFGTYPYQLAFRHNTISTNNGMALNIGWGSNNTKDLIYRPLVEYNKFDSCAQEATDAAVYHTRNPVYGSCVSRNWFNNSVKVVSGRIRGRYSNTFNDPKFGNIYHDNDAQHNNFVGNLHTGFSLNGFAGRLDGLFIGLAPGEPNYIVDCDSADDTNMVMALAGSTAAYADMRGYALSGSPGGSLDPSPHRYAAFLVDDRDPQRTDERGNITKLTYTGTWIETGSGGTDQAGGGYLDTYTSATANGAKAALTFTGTGTAIFGPKSAEQGQVEVRIDGVLVQTLNLQGSGLFQQVWYQTCGLVCGQHQVELTKISGTKLSVDGFIVFQ